VRRPWCVVVDIDDTLYLERDYVLSGLREVDDEVVRLGARGFREAAEALFEKGVRGTLFDDALRQLGADHLLQHVPRLVGVYRRHAPRITLLPDAVAALDRSRRSGRVAVVTDGPADSQRRKVDALGLRRWADPVVITDLWGPGYGKPHPRGFEAVETAQPGLRMAYVADNPAKDFMEPARRGWLTVRVRRPGGLHEHAPSGADVQAEIPDLTGLEQVLDSLSAGSEGRSHG
jgi:putative hydrolase of the HAD superfamily